MGTTMDLKEIKHIGDAHLAEKISEQLSRLNFNAIAITEGVRIESTAGFLENPVRFEGSFNTSTISEFTDYSNDQETAVVFVSDCEMKATAIFDLGEPDSPRNRCHKAHINLNATAEYKGLLEFLGRGISQQNLISWIEENHSNLSALGKEQLLGDNPPTIELSRAVSAIRNTKVKVNAEINNKIEDLSESQSTFASIDLENSDGNMPAYLDFTCVPYQGLLLPLQADNQQDDMNMQRTFRVRINVVTGKDKVTYSLKMMRQEKHFEIMTQAFKAQLRNELKKSVIVRIGSFR